MEHASHARIFIGIPIETNNVTQMLREHPLLADLPVHWIRDEDLHITLVSPWSTDDIEGAKRTFVKIKFPASFPLFFHTLETVPRDVPRVVWIQSHPSYSIITMKQDGERAFGIDSENRPFLPHITLARFIAGRQSNYVNPIHEPFDWAVLINTVCLYQSHITSEGSLYEKLMVRKLEVGS